MAEHLPQSDCDSHLLDSEEKHIANALVRFIRNRDGFAAFEYALIAGLVFLAIVGGLSAIGLQLDDWFAAVSEAFGD
jgi:pilus assembly protein Flp/PilA